MQEIYMAPEKRQQVLDGFRLVSACLKMEYQKI